MVKAFVAVAMVAFLAACNSTGSLNYAPSPTNNSNWDSQMGSYDGDRYGESMASDEDVGSVDVGL